jgi:hypothetical protein
MMRHFGLARDFRSRTAFAAAAVVAACLGLCQPTLAQSSTQSILVDPPFISLGLMQPRDTITRSFRLSNITNNPITIASVVPTCTCTTVDATGKVIPPKASIEIPLTMKVAASTGVKTAAVTLTFSDRSAPITLQMQGEIAYAVRSTCIDVIEQKRMPYINIFDDPQRSPSVAPPPLVGEMKVSCTDGRPFRVLSVMGKPPQFIGWDPASSEPLTAYDIVYDFQAIPCDRMPPYLIIETDHPLAPVIDMRVRHACTRIAPQLPFAEYRANLGLLRVGVPSPFEFELKRSQGWTVTGVQSKDPRIEVRFIQQRSDAEGAMVSMVATATAGTSPSGARVGESAAILLAPVSMTARDPSGNTRTSDFWVYAKIVPPDTAPPTATPSAPPTTMPSAAPTTTPSATQKSGS